MISTSENSGMNSMPEGNTLSRPVLTSYMKSWILNRSVMPTAMSATSSSCRAPLSDLPSRSKAKTRIARIARCPLRSATSASSNSCLASGERTVFAPPLGFFHGA